LTMGSVLEVVDAVELGIQLEGPDFYLRFSMRCGWRERPVWRFDRLACLRMPRQVWGTDRACAAVVQVGGRDRSLRRQVAVGPDLEETRGSQQLPIDVDDKPGLGVAHR
jgi:hypothetical protein